VQVDTPTETSAPVIQPEPEPEAKISEVEVETDTIAAKEEVAAKPEHEAPASAVVDNTPEPEPILEEPILEDPALDTVETQDPPVEAQDDPPVEAQEPPVVVTPKVQPAPEEVFTFSETETLTTPTALGSATTVSGGRVSTLEIDDAGDVDSVEIMTQPDFGRVTINPDNTLALVLSGTKDFGNISFQYQVTTTDGIVTTHTADLLVTEPTQDQGWGLGNHYLLEEDEQANMIVEHGDDHRKVYVSKSDDALSAEDIATLEGLNASDITKSWLLKHPEYGGSEDMALYTDIGMDIWRAVTTEGDRKSSHWLLFERGYTYEEDDINGRLISGGADGENALHPLHITAFGEGAAPIIDHKLDIFGSHAENIVFSDLHMTGGATILSADSLLFDNVTVSDDEFVVQGYGEVIEGLTFKNSEFIDVVKDAPTSDEWHPHTDRISGLYGQNIEGLLFEGTLWDHNAWTNGYDGTTDEGQPASQYSHNLYLQKNTFDVTFRESISMQGASFGAQFRGGVTAQDNVFLDNNAAVAFLGGNYKDAGYIGNYTLFSDNVITSAAHKDGEAIGAYSYGILGDGQENTVLDNIVAHLADPNNAEEFSQKLWTNTALNNLQTPYYDNTTVYNWLGSRNGDDIERLWADGVNGLTAQELNQITIQMFTADLLGDPSAAIADFATYARAISDEVPDAISTLSKTLVDYFQTGFGIELDGDGTDTALRFVPNDLGDGVRWDNELNWTGEETPTNGDAVFLGGNWVSYSSAGTNTVSRLDLGDGGTLDVSSGRLTVDGHITQTDTADINVSYAGQLWLENGSDSDTLQLNLDGGRIANTGHLHGVMEINATDGQLLLGVGDAVFDLNQDSSLTLHGDEVQAGFDGQSRDSAVLRMETGAQLTFVADDTGFATLQEFRSGIYDEATSDIASGVNLGNGTLNIDVTALDGQVGDYRLLEVDTLIGTLEEINISGLDAQDAVLNLDYSSGTIDLTLTEGDGIAVQTATGTELSEAMADADIWQLLTGDFGIYDEAAALPEEQETFLEAIE